MPITFHITPGHDTPIYKQIVDQVRRAVATNAAAPGEALPSVRGLAEQLVINPNTVARAYADLAKEGLVESLAGRGMVIARKRQVYTRAERLRRLEPALTAFLQEAIAGGFDAQEISDLIQRKLDQMDLPESFRAKT